MLDSTSTYGFVLGHPCHGFDRKPDPSLGEITQASLMTRGTSRGRGGPSGWSFVVASRRIRGGRGGYSRVWYAPFHRCRFTPRWAIRSPAWGSDSTRNAAVALFGEASVRQLDLDERYPVGAAAFSALTTMYRHREVLRQAVATAEGNPMVEAMRMIGRAIAEVTATSLTFAVLQRLLEGMLVPERGGTPGPMVFEAENVCRVKRAMESVLGARPRRGSDSEEEPSPSLAWGAQPVSRRGRAARRVSAVGALRRRVRNKGDARGRGRRRRTVCA